MGDFCYRLFANRKIFYEFSLLQSERDKMDTITDQELTEARTFWGVALTAISKAYDDSGIELARAVAKEAIDAAYGYDSGPVLFKPTMASGEQTFRPTKEGALSYFVGNDSAYPLDGGFGIKGWIAVASETSASYIQGDIAMWMGWVSFTDRDGNVTKVDKSWGYKKDEHGTLRIVLHHSSLPYTP